LDKEDTVEIHELKIPEGYDTNTQKLVGTFAAQLDDQLADLKRSLGTTTVAELEWQLDTGRNSIGMLLAHNAVVEAFWISVAASGITPGPQGDRRIKEITGIGGEDDGIPLSADAAHPEALKGYTLDDYLRMLDSARTASHTVMRGWADTGLDDTYSIEGHVFTKRWTVYHVLEHCIGHYGQIRLLKRIIKDRGLV
jgi:hypothetical protein